MSPLTQDELVAVARRYYPPGIQCWDSAGKTALETTRYSQAWDDELENPGRWHTLFNALDKEFPGCRMGDYTAPRFDAGRRLCVFLEPGGGLTKGAQGIVACCVSVLAPLYIVYGVQQEMEGGRRIGEPRLLLGRQPSEMVPYASTMVKHIEQIYQYRPVPIEFLQVRVPEISVDPFPLGEATLLHALFTTAPERFP